LRHISGAAGVEAQRTPPAQGQADEQNDAPATVSHMRPAAQLPCIPAPEGVHACPSCGAGGVGGVLGLAGAFGPQPAPRPATIRNKLVKMVRILMGET
jgi:hypothetical protein